MNRNASVILLGLQRKHIYGGTVPEAVVQKRRAKNRAARRARKGNVAAMRKQARLNRLAHQPRPRFADPFGRIVDAEVVDE